jgi:hypothetical protein
LQPGDGLEDAELGMVYRRNAGTIEKRTLQQQFARTSKCCVAQAGGLGSLMVLSNARGTASQQAAGALGLGMDGLEAGQH